MGVGCRVAVHRGILRADRRVPDRRRSLRQWIQLYEFNPRLLASITGALGRRSTTTSRTTTADLLIIASKSQIAAHRSPRSSSIHPLADELRVLGISSLRDLRTLRVANKTTINRILFWEGAPDKFPVIFRSSMSKRRAQFKSQQTDRIMALKRCPDSCGGAHRAVGADRQRTREPPAGRRAPTRFIRRRSSSSFCETPGAATLGRSRKSPRRRRIAAYRTVLVDCVEASNASLLWDQVLTLAVYLNRSAPAATLEPLLEDRRELTVPRAASPRHYRDWIELFRSVGSATTGIVRNAEPLLDVDVCDERRRRSNIWCCDRDRAYRTGGLQWRRKVLNEAIQPRAGAQGRPGSSICGASRAPGSYQRRAQSGQATRVRFTEE